MAFTLRDVLVSPKEKTAVVTAVFFALSFSVAVTGSYG